MFQERRLVRKNMKEYTQASWEDVQVKWEGPTPIDCFLKASDLALMLSLAAHLTPLSYRPSLCDSSLNPWASISSTLLLGLELSVFGESFLDLCPQGKVSHPFVGAPCTSTHSCSYLLYAHSQSFSPAELSSDPGSTSHLTIENHRVLCMSFLWGVNRMLGPELSL